MIFVKSPWDSSNEWSQFIQSNDNLNLKQSLSKGEELSSLTNLFFDRQQLMDGICLATCISIAVCKNKRNTISIYGNYENWNKQAINVQYA